MGIILVKAYNAKSKKLQEVVLILMMSFLTYLICTTTVHPWYLSIPIVLSVFHRRWWVLIWSFVIVFSYMTYSNPEFKESMLLTFVEYAIVLSVFIFESRKATITVSHNS